MGQHAPNQNACTSTRAINHLRLTSVGALCVTASSASPFIVMDPFCLRSFLPPQSSSPAPFPTTADEFVRHVNALYEEGQHVLHDGYAPFCKHLFIPTHLDVPAAYAAITDDNRHLMR